jgi:hypothetical protein
MSCLNPHRGSSGCRSASKRRQEYTSNAGRRLQGKQRARHQGMQVNLSRANRGAAHHSGTEDHLVCTDLCMHGLLDCPDAVFDVICATLFRKG